ncbi:tetratricopeptide repeat protein [Ferruginibacter sp. SUN002]|uniref:tetratricopeptide repeat protein n=1 Tax=Ferruginibacter sp. SUN002 TaxID=2937789 RepID=UPI003D35C906
MKSKVLFSLFFILIFLSACKRSTGEMFDEMKNLYKKKDYESAIKMCSKIIKRNKKLQEAYYYRGFCFWEQNKLSDALFDFEKILDMHMAAGGFRFELSSELAELNEEARYQIPYNDALYQKAQVEYEMGNLRNAYKDFQDLINENYEKSNCFLWLGTIMLKSGDEEKACLFFYQGKESADNDGDFANALKLLKQCDSISTKTLQR